MINYLSVPVPEPLVPSVIQAIADFLSKEMGGTAPPRAQASFKRFHGDGSPESDGGSTLAVKIPRSGEWTRSMVRQIAERTAGKDSEAILRALAASAPAKVAYHQLAEAIGDDSPKRTSTRAQMQWIAKYGKAVSGGEPWWPLVVEDDQYWMPRQVAEWILDAYDELSGEMTLRADAPNA